MRFEVLGALRLRDGSGDVPLSGRLRQGLLAMLLAQANEPVPVDTLVDALWGDGPQCAATKKVQLHAHRLRRLLDTPERLSFNDGGYRLRVLPGELDAEEFVDLADQASRLARTDPARCAELIRRALGLWRGRPYQDLDIAHLAPDVHRLSERRLAALEELYAAELECKPHTAVVPELSALALRYPLRERFQCLLMTALYRSGRQSDALRVYRDARRTLVDELGLEPGPELRRLEQRILAGGPVGAPNSAPARPFQLPQCVAGFVGRERELSRLDTILRDAATAVRVAAITGTAGVGKTALAVHWAQRTRHRYADGVLYVDLRGYGPDEPLAAADALASFLRAFGVSDTAIARDPAECAAQFRTLMTGKRILMVLDNARCAEQVRPLLPGEAPSCVVVTSRDRLVGLAAREGVHRVELARMGAEDAAGLLEEVLGPTTDAAATERLIEQCARLPLALRIAAERIEQRCGGRVATLVAELADEEARLDLLDTGDDHTSVRTVLSWSYQQLAPEAARMFRLFGLHPGHDIDIDALTALFGAAEVRVTRRLLDVLVRAHLVDQTAEGRYRQHDLLWAYAAELAKATDTESERTAALTRLREHEQATPR